MKDLTSSKLYIKGIIWIEEILFSNITKAWNYILGIPDNKRLAKVVKDLGY